MIDLLHLIDTYRIGGPGKTIINAARFIDPTRFRVHVASFTSPDSSKNEFALAVRRAGIPYLELVESRRFVLGHVDAIRAYVRSHGIKVLHAHGYRSDFFGYAALGRRRSGTALVTTHHGWIRNNWRQHVRASLALRLCAGFEGVQVVSHELLDDLPAAVRRSGRACVIHNGIVLSDYRPSGTRLDERRALGISDDEVLLAVIGRLSLEKGCLEMLDAFTALYRTRPNTRLIFVGEGPLEPVLRQSIVNRDLQNQVHVVPYRPEIQPLYEAVDVLVSPSRTEGISNVILEAMAFGRPVVATRVGGTREIVIHEQTGLLVEPLHPEAWREELTRLIDDPGFRQSLGVRGRERVERNFSFDRRMRLEEQFYDRALQAQRSR